MIRDFIKFNIENVKGSRRGSSLIQHDSLTRKKKSLKKYNNMSNLYSHNSQKQSDNKINYRICNLQTQVNQLSKDSNYYKIITQLAQIKSDIKMIKSHIFQHNNSSFNEEEINHKTNQSNDDDDTIHTEKYHNNNNSIRMRSQSSQNQFQATKIKKKSHLEQMLQVRSKKISTFYTKNTISLKIANSMVKQYKLQAPGYGTIFYGYCKRNSQQVAIKYSQQSLNHIFEVYERLWKNIGKAKWPCLNRIYDYKNENYSILMMQKNKRNIVGLPAQAILIDILRTLQFIHDCGYLYRNIEPQHFMLNENGQLVVIDFKRVCRYVDIKGHQMEVIDVYNGSLFASNNQVRGFHQGCKDDLQSLGYFALLLMNLEIPWVGMHRQDVIRVRSTITLQQLFKDNRNWIQYMAIVFKTARNERPDYSRLLKLIQS